MKIWAYTVYADFNLPDDSELGDTFDIVGTARVTGIEEELVDVSTAHLRAFVPGERKANLVLEVRKA